MSLLFRLMAQYRHLPVWKAAFALAVHWARAVRRFSRYHKYTLGSELRHTTPRSASGDGWRALTLSWQPGAALAATTFPHSLYDTETSHVHTHNL